MTLLELFLGFLRVGCFSFGGGYASVALIREVVLSHGWLTEEGLSYVIAVSESTPGPIMVNLATYIGSTQAGVPGALVATFAVVLPAFLIILALMAVLRRFVENPWVRAALTGLKAAGFPGSGSDPGARSIVFRLQAPVQKETLPHRPDRDRRRARDRRLWRLNHIIGREARP